MSTVGSDLGVDAERPKDREGPARDRGLGDVEVERHTPPAQEMDGPGGVEECRALREAIAAALRTQRRELGTRVGGEGRRAQRSVPSRASSRRFVRSPEGP